MQHENINWQVSEIGTDVGGSKRLEFDDLCWHILIRSAKSIKAQICIKRYLQASSDGAVGNAYRRRECRGGTGWSVAPLPQFHSSEPVKIQGGEKPTGIVPNFYCTIWELFKQAEIDCCGK